MCIMILVGIGVWLPQYIYTIPTQVIPGRLWWKHFLAGVGLFVYLIIIGYYVSI